MTSRILLTLDHGIYARGFGERLQDGIGSLTYVVWPRHMQSCCKLTRVFNTKVEQCQLHTYISQISPKMGCICRNVITSLQEMLIDKAQYYKQSYYCHQMDLVK
jgi:hypothetical protein